MEADLNFVVAAIRSCINKWQLECCEKMIELFIHKHGIEKENELLHELIEKTTFITII